MGQYLHKEIKLCAGSSREEHLGRPLRQAALHEHRGGPGAGRCQAPGRGGEAGAVGQDQAGLQICL